MASFWELLGLVPPSGEEQGTAAPEVRTGPPGAAETPQAQPQGGLYSDYDPRDVGMASLGQMGQAGALMMAMGQRLLPEQRAQLMAQMGGVHKGFQDALLNAEQARLLRTKGKREEETYRQKKQAMEALKQTPGAFEKYGVTPEMLPIIGPEGAADVMTAAARAQAGKTPADALKTQLEIAKLAREAELATPEGAARVAGEKKAAEEAAKSKQGLMDSAIAAQNTLPVISQARKDYEEAIKGGAVHPIYASAPARFLANIAGTETEGLRQRYDNSLANLQSIVTQIRNKGEGNVSNYERQLYNAIYPALTSGRPQDALLALKNLENDARRTIATGNPESPEAKPRTEQPKLSVSTIDAELARRGIAGR